MRKSQGNLLDVLEFVKATFMNVQIQSRDYKQNFGSTAYLKIDPIHQARGQFC